MVLVPVFMAKPHDLEVLLQEDKQKITISKMTKDVIFFMLFNFILNVHIFYQLTSIIGSIDNVKEHHFILNTTN